MGGIGRADSRSEKRTCTFKLVRAARRDPGPLLGGRRAPAIRAREGKLSDASRDLEQVGAVIRMSGDGKGHETRPGGSARRLAY